MVDYLSYRELISYEAMLISIIRSYVRGECDISWGENQTHEGQIKLFKNIITELHEKRTLGLRKHGSKSYDVLLVDTLVLEEENWEMKNFIKGFGYHYEGGNRFMNLKKLNDEIENRMVEIVTIGDYLQMGNVKSDYLLSGNDWSKILGSNSEIMKHIVGWGESNMGVMCNKKIIQPPNR